MAISRISSATGTTSIASMPTHQAGDLLLAFAFRDGSTSAPTRPSGWTNIASSGGNTCSICCAYKVAASGSETSGTWTSATSLIIVVYRGQRSAGTPIGAFAHTGGASTSITYPAITLWHTTGSSWVSGFAGHRSANVAIETAPSGMTNVTSVSDATDEAAAHDTNAAVSSWSPAAASVGGTSSGWRSITVEILADETFTATMAPTETADSPAIAPIPTPVTWNAADVHADVTLSAGDLIATRTSAPGDVYATGRASLGRSSGKYYFEFRRKNASNASGVSAGLARSTHVFDSYLGNSDNLGVGYYFDGSIYNSGSLATGLSTISDEEWGAIAVNFTLNKFWVRDSVSWDGDPAAGTGGYSLPSTGTYFPAFTHYDLNDSIEANFGASTFQFTVPSGFTAWQGAVDGWPTTVAPPPTTASLAATEGADAFVGAANRTRTATLDATEAADSFAGNAARGHPAVMALTEAADSAAMTALRGRSLALAAVEAVDTFAGSAAVTAPPGLVTADLAATEGSDTAAISATRAHPATLAPTEGSDAAAFNVQRGHPLALNGVEGGDTAAMSAKRGHPATLTVTEGSDVATASVTNGTAKAATLTVIEGGDTSAISVGVGGASASGSDYLQRRRRRRA